MDVLSDVLDTVRLTSTVFVRTELQAPWGIRTSPREHFAFHVISRGRCWLEVAGLAPVEVEAGDVVVLAPGHAHSLRSALDAPTRDIEDLLAQGALCRPAAGTAADPAGGTAASPAGGLAVSPATATASGTHLVCGSFRFDGVRGNVLMPALPVVLHVRAPALNVGPWLAQTIELLTYESFADRPGNATVVNRLCDALFVYLLRSHLASRGVRESNWLRALDEPQIGAALALMHEEPGRSWSVPMLAAEVGMSRSAFAARFAELVGESPIRYLMHWRLQKAASMLRTADTSIEGVAGHVGYDSVVAFSKAFKRSIGVPPGAYRRAERNGARERIHV